MEFEQDESQTDEDVEDKKGGVRLPPITGAASAEPPITGAASAEPNKVKRKRRKHRRGPTKREVGHAIGRMRRFSSLPSVDPLTLCFTVPWVYLSNHALILGLVRDRLASLPVGSHVSSIQYVPRNVINGTRDLADRWLVTVTSERAKQELMLGLDWRGYKIGVRLYIDVLRIEYYNYLRFLELNNAMMTLKLPAPEAVPTS